MWGGCGKWLCVCMLCVLVCVWCVGDVSLGGVRVCGICVCYMCVCVCVWGGIAQAVKSPIFQRMY